MPILELCAGYGGLGMAAEALTGDKVAYVAESNEAASLVLAHRFPDAPNIGDITTYDWTRLVGLVDIVTAGFSCQDISNAGPRGGISGKRSRVWKDVAKAVGVLRPRLVFLENVAVIRSRGLDIVAQDLAAIGYDLWWTSFRASALGAAHHRDRWFGIAFPAGVVPDARGIGRAARRTEPAEQQRHVRRPAGARGALPADADGTRLEVGRVEPPREEQPPPVGGGVGPQDAHGPTWLERGGTAPGEAQEGGHGPTLDDEVSFLLPHADSGGRKGQSGYEPEQGRRGEPAHGGHSPADWWGDYLPAIRRWERLIGVPAPAPTETGPRGGRRLTARFAEWLMGVPGHVTDVPGLTRAEQLERIGNGAMPVQAHAAYEYLFHLIKEHA
ncbi:DNA cytosine methyltransferase [Streptomyces paludis]|uniref:DNA (cytosine-5-)-methyltransferase n=1 Tax=Streptomyces paludis TaxID=2282738 RepID=A0A345HWP9_9ACTN|nr:DNA cytosine methyltransferase [Streptomyces paludis]AXG81123.1 DNA cytosine methyltransferase [Streptomyces paludis]